VSADSPPPAVRFASASRLLTATFDGGRLTAASGLLWLAEAEATRDLCAAFADCLPAWRRRPGQHTLAALVRQRVFPIVYYAELAFGTVDRDRAGGYAPREAVDHARRNDALVGIGATSSLAA
jgi:hypothetical protein